MSTDVSDTETQETGASEQDAPVLDERDQAQIDDLNRDARPAKEETAEKTAEETGETVSAEETAKEETGQKIEPEGEEKAEGAETKAPEWVTPNVIELAAAAGVDQEMLQEHFRTPEDLERFLVIRQLVGKRETGETGEAAEQERVQRQEAERQAAQAAQTEQTQAQTEEAAPGDGEDLFPYGPRVNIPPPLDPELCGEEIVASDRAMRERQGRSELVLHQAIERLEWTIEQITGQQVERFDSFLDQLDRGDLYGKSPGEASDEQRARRQAVWGTFVETKGARPQRDHVKRASDQTHYQELFTKLRKDLSTTIQKQSARRTRAGGAAAKATAETKPKSKGSPRLTAESAGKLDRLFDELGLADELED